MQEDAPGPAGDLPWPEPRRARAVVWLLLGIYTLSFIDRQILALMVEPIKADMEVSDFGFGLLTGLAFSLFYTLFGIPFARIADRGSRRGLIAFGVAFWSLATAACGLARGYSQLFLARIGVGIGEATLTPAANSMIADLVPPERRGRAIAIYTLGIPIGSALAFLFGGALIELASTLDIPDLPLIGAWRGWQLVFLLFGLPGLAFALFMMRTPEPVRRGRVADGRSVPVGEAARYFLRRWRVFGLAFLGIACLAALGYGTIYFIAAFFGRVHGYSPGETGLVFGLILLIAGTGGILVAGRLADYLVGRGHDDAHIRILLLATLFMAPFAIAFPLVASPVAAIWLLACAIFFSHHVWGTAYAGIAAVTPNALRGQATAIYLFIVNLIGLGLGPTMFGYISSEVFADESMIDRTYVVMALLTLPVAGLCLFAARPAFARQLAEIREQERAG